MFSSKINSKLLVWMKLSVLGDIVNITFVLSLLMQPNARIVLMFKFF